MKHHHQMPKSIYCIFQFSYGFFSPVTSSWCFLIFSISLLKLSLWSSIFLLSLLTIFVAITLKSLSDKLFISISWRFFLKFHLVLLFWNIASVSSFCLTSCVGLCALDKTASSPRPEGVASCRRWMLRFNLTLAVGCLRNLHDWVACFISNSP